jgi:rhodanese-related sulfurtransferase/DNA-binding transcriptional ArsR family regulator
MVTPNIHFEKDQYFRGLERVGKALGSARRLELLDHLAAAERSVEEIAGLTGMSVANASQHLRSMLHAGLVQMRREGPYALYSLASDSVRKLLAQLRSVGSEINPSLVNRSSSVSIVDHATLANQLREKDDKLVVVDVRPQDEYRTGRIRGAKSLPLGKNRPSDLGPGTQLVVYGRNRSCELVEQAIEEFRNAGYSVSRLKGGFAEWKREGLPTTRTLRIK